MNQRTNAPAPPLSFADLEEHLAELTAVDQERLRRRARGAAKVCDPRRREAIAEEIADEVTAARRRVARRRAAVPSASYPPALPITEKIAEIRGAIRDHQVVIVAGETGSGKTTQLPKVCLELGRGVRGLIGHTQPRRLAARTVADRLADELDVPRPSATRPGQQAGVVGYQVRFTAHVADDTLVKLMTDGILLAEISHDRMLRAYDTLIIDEAHERSLNIDFIIGYLKRLLPRRPDLKVIITSATIDPERFSRHFGGAPVVEVSGRTYPVEVRYRPLVAEVSDPAGGGARAVRDQIQGISDAVDELYAEGSGDILVFLSGEREIRDTADALRRLRGDDAEILPLFARLSAADQYAVFRPSSARRRIVLATNVAETSLTVPGIKYVVDPGTARISRYSPRTKVQRLPIEPISQASADQRKGRCGRTSDGICIRLYSAEDYERRPPFTDPEIVRTNLASVILQLEAFGLGDIETFPFLDPPDRRSIKAGVQLLEELGAFAPPEGAPTAPGRHGRGERRPRTRLTPVGRRLAQLPIDPRLGRMVLEAQRNGCVREVTVIAAALSIQDPRERPAEHRQAADAMHARFVTQGPYAETDRPSDFLVWLNAWQYLQEQQDALSSSQFRRLCRAEYWHYLRVREWQDLYGQLRHAARGLGIALNRVPADPDDIHRSLLTGLLSHIGLRDPQKRDYLGARGTRFAIFPDSALFKKQPRWAMAAELVETSRLWGRTVARVEPEWVEPLAQHLVARSYSEPHWEKKRGAVMAYEKVTLYGIPIVPSRSVNYARVDPALCRELFIRHALVEGEVESGFVRHAFFRRNRRLLDGVEELEERVRRRDILVDDETLFAFYDERVGEEVTSVAAFDTWWRKARNRHPDLLDFSPDMLVTDDTAYERARAYPDVWEADGLRLRLSYRFQPGADDDGLTVHVPLPVLNQLAEDGFDWQVPGMRHELVTALLRSLPKQLRRNFVPAPQYAAWFLGRVRPGERPLLEALSDELRRHTGVIVPLEAWRLDQVPGHLRPTFRVEDEDGRQVAAGKDLADLRRRLRPRMQATLSETAGGVETHAARAWEFGTLPRMLESRRGAHLVRAYPALVDRNSHVAVRLFPSEDEQRRAMWRGTRRLLTLTLPPVTKPVLAALDNRTKLALTHAPHDGPVALFDDCLAASLDALVARAGGPAWDEEAFGKLRDAVRADLHDTMVDTVTTVARILEAAHAVGERLGHAGRAGTTGRPAGRKATGAVTEAFAEAVADMRDQLAGLVLPGFVTATGRERLQDLQRYLRGIDHRLDKLPEDVGRDAQRMAVVHDLESTYRERLSALPDRAAREAMLPVRWMIEELRVSFFAQRLGTAHPVSEKRVRRAIDQVR